MKNHLFVVSLGLMTAGLAAVSCSPTPHQADRNPEAVAEGVSTKRPVVSCMYVSPECDVWIRVENLDQFKGDANPRLVVFRADWEGAYATVWVTAELGDVARRRGIGSPMWLRFGNAGLLHPDTPIEIVVKEERSVPESLLRQLVPLHSESVKAQSLKLAFLQDETAIGSWCLKFSDESGPGLILKNKQLDQAISGEVLVQLLDEGYICTYRGIIQTESSQSFSDSSRSTYTLKFESRHPLVGADASQYPRMFMSSGMDHNMTRAQWRPLPVEWCAEEDRYR